MGFEPGAWNVICDMCGRKRKNYECRMNYNNLLVCSDTCWEPQHPQDFVSSIPDDQSVPDPRPDSNQAQGTTAIKVAVVNNDTSIQVDSISGISENDGIIIDMDDGSFFATFVNGTPSGFTVPIYGYSPGTAAIGNTVYLP